jgi:hypothetical protein
VPSTGDRFPIRTFGSRRGDCATPPDGFALNYDAASLTLMALGNGEDDNRTRGRASLPGRRLGLCFRSQTAVAASPGC